MDAEANNIGAEEVSKEKLVQDLKTVAHDAEELIKATAEDMGEKTKEARVRLQSALGRAKETCKVLQDKAIAGAKATDKVIRDHPYQSIGVGFALGVLVGVLINRK